MEANTIAELDIEYIVFNGYYSRKDDGHELQEHTEETKTLYQKGLNTGPSIIDDEDVFNGVCFNTDNTPLAEWWLQGKEEYYKIQ